MGNYGSWTLIGYAILSNLRYLITLCGGVWVLFSLKPNWLSFGLHLVRWESCSCCYKFLAQTRNYGQHLAKMNRPETACATPLWEMRAFRHHFPLFICFSFKYAIISWEELGRQPFLSCCVSDCVDSRFWITGSTVFCEEWRHSAKNSAAACMLSTQITHAFELLKQINALVMLVCFQHDWQY